MGNFIMTVYGTAQESVNVNWLGERCWDKGKAEGNEKRHGHLAESGVEKGLTFRENVMYIIRASFTERYRSGHNGAVLKTVRGQPHAGSNPVLSAIYINDKGS
jgi:hypothetical protein